MLVVTARSPLLRRVKNSDGQLPKRSMYTAGSALRAWVTTSQPARLSLRTRGTYLMNRGRSRLYRAGFSQ